MVEIPKLDIGMNEAKLKEINDGLEAIKLVMFEIGRAKRAGLDVSAQEAAAIDTKTKLEQIKSVYYPGR